MLLDIDQHARAAAAIDPSLVLSGGKPRLIDEWQQVPEIWNHVRRAIDAHEGPFILTGSAVPADDAARHTGALSFTRLRMRPMTLFEAGHSSGTVSLGADIRRVDGVSRDPLRVWTVIRSIARHVATEVSVATIARGTGGPEGPVDDDTVRSYLAALERLMIIEGQPAWAPRLRSRARLLSAPKHYYYDPSLAAYALRATPARLLADLNYLGHLFESLVVRDLRVYAQHNDARVLHYRDNIGEVDVIVEAGVRWGALEVKLGAANIKDAAASLKKFVTRIDTGQCGEPAFLGVVVPTRYGYVQEDGVHVIHVQALAP